MFFLTVCLGLLIMDGMELKLRFILKSLQNCSLILIVQFNYVHWLADIMIPNPFFHLILG